MRPARVPCGSETHRITITPYTGGECGFWLMLMQIHKAKSPTVIPIFSLPDQNKNLPVIFSLKIGLLNYNT